MRWKWGPPPVPVNPPEYWKGLTDSERLKLFEDSVLDVLNRGTGAIDAHELWWAYAKMHELDVRLDESRQLHRHLGST